jgi:putative phage-type endonuclease
MDEIEQGSAAWHALRLGKVTASRVADIVAKTKSGVSAMRGNYMAQLVAERLSGVVEEGFTNATIQWGSEQEAEARLAYAFRTGLQVDQVAFVPHPTIGMSGASPDGLVGDDGLVEFKCPLTATHIESLLGGSIPGKYETQMMWQMACTGRSWCDFASFDPRLPEAMRLLVKRVPRNPIRIVELETEVRGFLAEVDQTVAQLTRLYSQERQAA